MSPFVPKRSWRRPAAALAAAAAIVAMVVGAIASHRGTGPKEVPRIAYLTLRTAQAEAPVVTSLLLALAKEGLERGRDYQLTVWAEGDRKVPVAALAAQRARAGDAILYGPTRSPALAAAVTGAPTVFNFHGDFFAEMRELYPAVRPNATGTNIYVPLLGRRLELLAQVLPEGAPIAFLWDQTTGDGGADQEIAALPEALRRRLRIVMVAPGEMPDLGAQLRARGLRAAYVPMHGMFFNGREALVASLNGAGIATMYAAGEFTRAGGLFSVQGDHGFRMARIARVMAAVLGGVAPARIPVDQPKEHVFEVNLRTAGQLGLPLSRDLLAQAHSFIR